MYKELDVPPSRPHYNKPGAVAGFPGLPFPLEYVPAPHHNYYEVVQSPYPQCKCFARNTGLAAFPPPIPGSIPFQTPSGGGPE